MDRETNTTISVKFTDWILPYVHFIGLDEWEERVRFVCPHLVNWGGGFDFGGADAFPCLDHLAFDGFT